MYGIINQEIKTFIDKCTAIADELDGSRFIVKFMDQLKNGDDDTTQIRQSIAPKMVELVIAMCRESIQLLRLNLSLYQKAPLASTIITRATIERAAKAFYLIDKDESGIELLGRTLNEFLYYRYHEWNHARLTSNGESTQDAELINQTWNAYVSWAEMVKACHIGVELKSDPSDVQSLGLKPPKAWAKLKLRNFDKEFIVKIEKLFSRVKNGALATPMYSHLSSVAHYNITSLLSFDRITLDSTYKVRLSLVMDQPSAGAREHSEHWSLWSCVGVYSMLCEILEQFESDNLEQDLLTLRDSFDPVFSHLLISEQEMRAAFDGRAQ